VWWGYGLYPDKPGNYIKKKMQDCTGAEILEETLRHLKLDAELPTIMRTSQCIPCMMPYVNSIFVVRKNKDFPAVVPKGSTNFAFTGQYTDIPGECCFTVEKSIRSAWIAVSTLLKVEPPPPLYSGLRDPKAMVAATKRLLAG